MFTPTVLKDLTLETGRVIGPLLGITGQRIVILGVGDLIEPLVRLLLLSGAKVCLSRFNAERLEQNVTDYRQLAWSPEHVCGLAADASSDANVQAVVRLAAEQFGGIDAGVFAVGAVTPGANAAPDESILGIQPDRMLVQFNADAIGGLRFAQALDPHLRASAEASGQPARFIVTGSIGPGANGSAPQTRSFGYNCAKASTHLLMQMLAHSCEWGTFCRVNGVAPGPIVTKLNRARMSPDQSRGKTALANTPAGGFSEMDDPAGAFYFLLSNLGKGISGQIIVVDNGLSGTRAPY